MIFFVEPTRESIRAALQAGASPELVLSALELLRQDASDRTTTALQTALAAALGVLTAALERAKADSCTITAEGIHLRWADRQVSMLGMGSKGLVAAAVELVAAPEGVQPRQVGQRCTCRACDVVRASDRAAVESAAAELLPRPPDESGQNHDLN